jgi:hypothetical protein
MMEGRKMKSESDAVRPALRKSQGRLSQWGEEVGWRVALRPNSRNSVAGGEKIQREIRGGLRIGCDRIGQLCAKKVGPLLVRQNCDDLQMQIVKGVGLDDWRTREKLAATELGGN